MHLHQLESRRRLGHADHGVLATVHAERGVDAVPVCFVIQGDVVAVPIDTVKPKVRTDLQRSRNLSADDRATLLVEQWDAEDWSRLWWVRCSLRRVSGPDDVAEGSAAGSADGTRDRLSEMLRAKYSQYRQAEFADLLVFDVVSLTGWSAAES